MPLTQDLGRSAGAAACGRTGRKTSQARYYAEGAPCDGDDTKQRTELRQLRSHHQRRDNDRRVSGERRQRDFAALARAMPQRLGQHQRQQGARGKAAGESEQSPGGQSRHHTGELSGNFE